MSETKDVKCIALFNNKGGVGKTSLVYHLAWMYADLGYTVVAADLDPQANLTGMFLDDDRIEKLWDSTEGSGTIYNAIHPLLGGTGDIRKPQPEEPTPGLRLVTGDMLLSKAEDQLSSEWPKCLDRDERAFRVISAIWRALRMTANEEVKADLVLVDVGPNLGALNRAVLIASDHVVVPLAPDLYSIQGLRNLGPVLTKWRQEWADRRDRNPVADLALPRGDMQPIGYVVLQHSVRLNRPVQAYERWIKRIPSAYGQHMLGKPAAEDPVLPDDDPYCLGSLKHYRSLMPLAQEARKPMFFLKPADGAIGAHVNTVRDCYDDFRKLAIKTAEHCGLRALRS